MMRRPRPVPRTVLVDDHVLNHRVRRRGPGEVRDHVQVRRGDDDPVGFKYEQVEAGGAQNLLEDSVCRTFRQELDRRAATAGRGGERRRSRRTWRGGTRSRPQPIVRCRRVVRRMPTASAPAHRGAVHAATPRQPRPDPAHGGSPSTATRRQRCHPRVVLPPRRRRVPRGTPTVPHRLRRLDRVRATPSIRGAPRAAASTTAAPSVSSYAFSTMPLPNCPPAARRNDLCREPRLRPHAVARPAARTANGGDTDSGWKGP